MMLTTEDKKIIEKLEGLPVGYWDFKNDDTKEYTHGIHNYPAMMVSPISRNLIKIVKEVQPVEALFDPFSGSGTVLVEGMLAGIPCVAGNDINPLALLLIKTKTTKIEYQDVYTCFTELMEKIRYQVNLNFGVLSQVDDYIQNVLGLEISGKKGWGDEAPRYLKQYCFDKDVQIDIPDFKNLGYWFRPRVVLELAIIKAEIEKIVRKDIREYAFIAMSEAIRFISNRRNGEFKMFRMPAAKVEEFRPDVMEEFFKILLRNMEKMRQFVEFLDNRGVESEVTIFKNNTCELKDVPNQRYDLIITSPPYGDSRTTVAYGEYSRLSLQWINLFGLTEKEIMGVDKSLMGGQKYRKGFTYNLKSDTLRATLEKIKEIDVERAGDVYSFYLDLDAAIRSVAEKTKIGGYHFWVVGNRTVKNNVLQTDVIISELAKQYGLKTIYTIDRNIPNKVMPSRNSPTNVAGDTVSTMTMEHIVVLRKI